MLRKEAERLKELILPLAYGCMTEFVRDKTGSALICLGNEIIAGTGRFGQDYVGTNLCGQVDYRLSNWSEKSHNPCFVHSFEACGEADCFVEPGICSRTDAVTVIPLLVRNSVRGGIILTNSTAEENEAAITFARLAGRYLAKNTDAMVAKQNVG